MDEKRHSDTDERMAMGFAMDIPLTIGFGAGAAGCGIWTILASPDEMFLPGSLATSCAILAPSFAFKGGVTNLFSDTSRPE